MSTNKQWKDLFNDVDKQQIIDIKNKSKSKTDLTIIEDTIKSNNNGIYFREKIPQSVIKKSIKDAYKK